MADELPVPGAYESEWAFTSTDVVIDRRGHARWVVLAMFVDHNGTEPRCIEYRVRVVPESPTPAASMLAVDVIAAELEADANRRDRPPVYLAAEVSAPTEGIPRRVFEERSQSRMLAKAQQRAKAYPWSMDPQVAAALERQVPSGRVGRPPAMSLGQKLKILAAIETAFVSGGTLQDVANAHHMSRSSVRDLLSWARAASSGPLFTRSLSRRAGGELTPAARALLQRGVE